MWRIVCPKMSVRNCHYSLRSSPDKSSSQSTHPSTEPFCSPCCAFPRHQSVLFPFPRHQSVLFPCRCEVLFTSFPQYCCMVNMAFVYMLPKNYDVIHTQPPIVIQLWFMHDKHLNFSDAATAIQFTQIQLIERTKASLVSSYANHAVKLQKKLAILRYTVIPRLTSDPANEFFG